MVAVLANLYAELERFAAFWPLNICPDREDLLVQYIKTVPDAANQILGAASHY